MKWQIQIPFRRLKKALQKSQEQITLSDFSHVALFNEQAQLIHVVGPHPLHYFGISQAASAIKQIIKLGPQDMVVTNDPSCGSPRLCDLNFVKAIYNKNTIRGYAVIQVSVEQLLHTKNILNASSNQDEGYKIPPTPLDLNGPVELALTDYLLQSKIDRSTINNLIKQVRSAFLPLENVLNQIQSPELKDLNSYTEDLIKKNLERFPDGDFAHTGQNFSLKLKVKQHVCTVQFPASLKESNTNKNCTYFLTASSCLWFFLSLIEDEIPINEGTLRAISIEAPQGSIVNCSLQKATLMGYYLISNQIIEGLFEIYKKLNPLDEKKLFFTPSTFACFKTENKFMTQVLGQGKSATSQGDGTNVIISDTHNLKALDAETIESLLPLEIQSYLLHGHAAIEHGHNGGAGVKMNIKFKEPTEVYVLKNFSGKSKQPTNLSKQYSAEENLVIQTGIGDNFITTEA